MRPEEEEPLSRARARLGQVLRGKYRLDGVLGVGGMATVFRATHRNQAEFAVKVLHPELSARADIRVRFLREGYAANSVRHEGTVRVVDDDVTEDGAAFLVMELLDGMTAEEAAKRAGGRLPMQVAASIVAQLLEVLEAAHAKNIVHRDIKPANLFLTRKGEVKVLDFGIARARDAAIGDGTKTGEGIPLGTPAFMAPEQAVGRSQEIDARTDVWGAGATFFTLTSGAFVHQGASASELLVMAATAPARSLVDAVTGAPAGIAAVIDRALAFERERRWPSAREMRLALEQACRDGFGVVPTSGAVVSAMSLPDAPVTDTKMAIVSVGDGSDAFGATVQPEAQPPPRKESGQASEAGSPPVSSTLARPPRRRSALAVILAAATGLAVVAWMVARPHLRPSAGAPSASASGARAAPSTTRDVTVLVYGIENQTGDPVFDGTIDAIFVRALMRSVFIDGVSGAALRTLATEVNGDRQALDDGLGAKLAARDRRRVIVLRGKVTSQGPGYVLSIQATEGGASLLSSTRTADSVSRVVPTVGSLAWDLRAALGEARPSSPAAEEWTGMSTLLEADQEITLGRGATDTGNYASAISHLRRALAIDPQFSFAHASLAIVLQNQGRLAEAVQEYRLALEHSDQLGPRERLRCEGDYHHATGDIEGALRAYEELQRLHPGALAAETMVALACAQARQMKRALEIGQRAARQHPKSVIAQSNLAYFEILAGDPEAADRDAARAVHDFAHAPPHAYVDMAVAGVLAGNKDAAANAYAALAELDAPLAAAGLTDLALAEGRPTDAIAVAARALEGASDESSDVDAVVADELLLVEAHMQAGDKAGAADALAKVPTDLPAPSVYAAATLERAVGSRKRADDRIAPLRSLPGLDPQFYVKLYDADVRFGEGKLEDAAAKYLEAQRVSDSWLGHFGLGRTYLAKGAYDEARRELEACNARRGEGAVVLLDGFPSLRLLPPVTYYLARAEEGQKSPDAAAAYRAFLDLVPAASHDRLALDAQRRLAALGGPGAR